MDNSTYNNLASMASPAYDEEFWNELLENPPTPCLAAGSQPLLQMASPKLQEVVQQAEQLATSSPYGSDRYTSSEEDLLLEIWPGERSGRLKMEEFNRRSGSARSLEALHAKFRDLRNQGHEALHVEVVFKRDYSVED